MKKLFKSKSLTKIETKYTIRYIKQYLRRYYGKREKITFIG